MSSDGNLRQIFLQHLPEAFWQSVETWSTGQGVPDVHYLFPPGKAGWIENKLVTSGWEIGIRPGQVGWLSRYARLGGRCFVAVRVIKRNNVDELWLYNGGDVKQLTIEGLRKDPFGLFAGGPARWNWKRIEHCLKA